MVVNIYYKKETVFCKYPFQTEVDYRYVSYSKSKKKWVEFAKSDVTLTMSERVIFIANKLNLTSNQIKLIKY